MHVLCIHIHPAHHHHTHTPYRVCALVHRQQHYALDQSAVVSRFLGIHARTTQNPLLLDSVKAEKVNIRRDKWSPVLAGVGVSIL